jgi:ADP-ribose pyrophosphatase YjhB (NUDIX family)
MKHPNTLQVGVKSFIFNKEGEILIIKRDPKKYPGITSLWDIPGGRIDPKSTLENNLKREIYEETKLKPKILSILAAQDIIKPDIRVVRLTYISYETSSGSKVILSDEHTEFKWVPIEFLLKINNSESYIRAIVKDKSKMSFIKDIISKHLDR